MTMFLLLFGLLNVFTPMVLLSTSDPPYDVKQRLLMRNMFLSGMCMLFVSAGLYFIG